MRHRGRVARHGLDYSITPGDGPGSDRHAIHIGRAEVQRVDLPLRYCSGA